MSLKRKKSPVSPERGQIIVLDEKFVFAKRILEVRIKKNRVPTNQEEATFIETFRTNNVKILTLLIKVQYRNPSSEI